MAADVTRTLGSVYRMNEGGNVVVFDGKSSYMVNNKSRKITPIVQENGQYAMYVWVKDDDEKNGTNAVSKVSTSNRFAALEEEGQDFQRHAQW